MDLIINFTPTGMVPDKTMTPYVPVTVAEIVEDVHQAVEKGITIVHLHARDEQSGQPTSSSELYGRIIEGIRSFAPELIICVSLSGRNVRDVRHRAEPLRLDGALKPDMGSLTLSSLNFARDASVNTPDTVLSLAAEMDKRGILPELEAFDVGMINYAKYLAGKGVLTPPHYFNLLFGNIAGAQADLLHLGMMIRDLPPDSFWSLGGIGQAQFTVNAMAVAAGGGVRVGIEDNIWFDTRRSCPATNAELLDRIHLLAQVHERRVMSSAALRSTLGLHKGFGHYGREV
ncbi:3-keto-5-aminohexanoate cleavage protein [Prosthecochloris sp. N3]|uniref:3-keto-5-aminohexanoate cleavage protein n=1 Tax=Prosthecochloris ethylica TaxID=2743976 RepID=A0ABR9XQW1_9CHLB|nr:3-keto-5-aminohexanoate cleavage protein [Prosthecochloris ethylica]MBF0586362.1 3-keto-5-aminohexanoate cleavage protein [Prosthecochloris ethylica]MBF0636420.1 3-keto-5-aminohexanoate cleavage protein [Prosthecochloris ethylica]MEC9487010.1 3-keto-5-aminohexanoate cleavage protein [Prosthecochloris sp.]NUK47594.1 3-keto-5-aminohexanoate cleavage protein [Prosthecochloris ethylica]